MGISGLLLVYTAMIVPVQVPPPQPCTRTQWPTDTNTAGRQTEGQAPRHPSMLVPVQIPPGRSERQAEKGVMDSVRGFNQSPSS